MEWAAGLPLGRRGQRVTLNRDKIRDCTCSHKSSHAILSLIHIPAPDWPLILLWISFNTPAGKRSLRTDTVVITCPARARNVASFSSGVRALRLDFIGEPLISPWILYINTDIIFDRAVQVDLLLDVCPNYRHASPSTCPYVHGKIDVPAAHYHNFSSEKLW